MILVPLGRVRDTLGPGIDVSVITQNGPEAVGKEVPKAFASQIDVDITIVGWYMHMYMSRCGLPSALTFVSPYSVGKDSQRVATDLLSASGCLHKATKKG